MTSTAPAAGRIPIPSCNGNNTDARRAEGLLNGQQLLLGIAGHCQGGSPLIGWVRELADLHATLLTASVSAAQHPTGFDAADTGIDIGAIRTLIDDWSALHLPQPTGARRHTHSLGEVISHVAATYVQVQWTLHHDHCAEHHHQATQRMAQILQGYNDLIEEIRALRVEFPLGWRGIRLDRRSDADSLEHSSTTTHTRLVTNTRVSTDRMRNPL